MPLLSGVTFSIHPGQALILRGPNGAGKTTLLRVLAGLQPPLAGAITGPEIAYASHSDGIKSTLTVTENLRFWASVFGSSDIAPALEAYHLTALQSRAAGNLSAGQKRRLGLARMQLSGAALWLMDEPTVSLDGEAVGWFSAAVRAHLGKGGLALIATHIELGLDAEILDIRNYRAKPELAGSSDEAFL